MAAVRWDVEERKGRCGSVNAGMGGGRLWDGSLDWKLSFAPSEAPANKIFRTCFSRFQRDYGMYGGMPGLATGMVTSGAHGQCWFELDDQKASAAPRD